MQILLTPLPTQGLISLDKNIQYSTTQLVHLLHDWCRHPHHPGKRQDWPDGPLLSLELPPPQAHLARWGADLVSWCCSCYKVAIVLQHLSNVDDHQTWYLSRISRIIFVEKNLGKGAHPCTSSSEQGGGKRVLEDFFLKIRPHSCV